MLVISSREFRQHQKMYFERADQGEQIIVQRGKNKAYQLTPVDESNLHPISERIQQSIRQVEEGKSKRISSREEIDELLGL